MARHASHTAALLIADGTKSDLETAAACRINRRTLAQVRHGRGEKSAK
jgi:hypothetical protein